MEPADAKELIDEAIERAEEQHESEAAAERAVERRFRNRASLLVGIFAVLLAIIHMAAASAQRESLLKGIEASDSFAYMQAKIVRETVLTTASANGHDQAQIATWTTEARRLRSNDKAGHGIKQLESLGIAQRMEGNAAAIAGERYELAETALQVAIVLLSIALIASSLWITVVSSGFAAIGVALAIATHFGVQLL
jgi:uncharacterized protein DUF4337